MATNVDQLLRNIANFLEVALEEKDWYGVSEAYTMLTGHDISEFVPKEDENDKDVLMKEMLDRIKKLESEKSTPKKTTRKKAPVKKKAVKKAGAKKPRTNMSGSPLDEINKFKVKKNKPSRKVEGTSASNKFDKMEVVAGEDNGYDDIDDNKPPSPRTRQRFEKKEVFCEDCKLNVLVHPSFARAPYYCADVKVGKCPNKKKND